jgi:tRNA(Arg) A34 adenosine deaminase TadA
MGYRFSRRSFLNVFGAASLGTLSTACAGQGLWTPPPTATPSLLPITQPTAPSDRVFADYAENMRQLALASGDQAFGAIVVKANRVVGLGPSRVVVGNDPTAHAEMEAIRDACRRIGTRDLSGCILYSTSHPCPMCEAAAYWARIDRMLHGTDALDAGAPRLCAS